MSIFARGKHDRRRVPAQTGPAPAGRTSPRRFPPPVPMTLPPPVAAAVARAHQDTVAFPAPRPFSRPYPGRRGSQPPRHARAVPPSPVRDGVLLTARASDFRFPLVCACRQTHVNTNVDTFRDLYISAEWAGWQQDPYGTWRCPRCARRHRAVFGVPPVAAIKGKGA